MRFEVYTFKMFFFPKSVFLNFYNYIHIKRPTGTCCFTFPHHGIISVKTEIKRRLCKIKKRFSLVCKYLRTKVNIVFRRPTSRAVFIGVSGKRIHRATLRMQCVCLLIHGRRPMIENDIWTEIPRNVGRDLEIRVWRVLLRNHSVQWCLSGRRTEDSEYRVCRVRDLRTAVVVIWPTTARE